jgi:hypothetical protein
MRRGSRPSLALLLVLAGCHFSVAGLPNGAGSSGPADNPRPPDPTSAPMSVSSPADGAAGADVDLLPPTASDAAANSSGSRAVGQSCGLFSPCGGGLTCLTVYDDRGQLSVWAGGYCTRPCATSADCDSGSTCLDLNGKRMCAVVCPPSCRFGYECCRGVCISADYQCTMS